METFFVHSNGTWQVQIGKFCKYEDDLTKCCKVWCPNQSATTPLVMMNSYGQTSFTIFPSHFAINSITFFIHSLAEHRQDL